MTIEAKIERMVKELRSRVELPLAIALWNGRRFLLSDSPRVTLRIPEPTALRYLMHPSLASLGEAYVEGHLDIEGPISEALRAAEGLSRHSGAAARGRRPLLAPFHSKKADAEAIRHHYDVSNDFYALWLDREMVYSCAYFKSGEEDLDTAQQQKLDHICRKLRLAPGDRFLDIGCGWGALVRHAARHYGVQATGITLSHNQFALANERIRAERLSERCRVLLQDYRDVPGEAVYDKIASVGMFEHVGLRKLPEYFGVIHRLLRDGGIVMNHGITATSVDNRWVGLGAGDFIDRYVFPGGELPHLWLVAREMASTGLEIMDIETLRLHYAKTLWKWSERLEANLDRARAHAGEKRLRVWRAYLAGCAHGFEQRWMSIQQVLAVKTEADTRTNPLPWTRSYVYE
jgi:cyclopropane-fatty-acyl-phospholipid synthase